MKLLTKAYTVEVVYYHSLPETCVLNGRLIWEVKTTQVASLHIPFSEQVLYIEAKVSALIFIFIISNASKSNDLND